MRRVQQAVILAGGRGSRLKPLTDSIPKPMIRFHGRPFLEYLIELLKHQGFTDILLLLGYLPDVIQSYFDNGRKWSVNITYSVSEVGDETGTRLRKAQGQLDPVFLLMYCDNYWPMQADRMWEDFVSSEAMAQVTAYSNDDGYTKDNIQIDADHYVRKYDKKRESADLAGVDVGFVLLHRTVLDLIPDGNVSFETEVYPRLVAARQLRAFVTHHRYYSVGSHARLESTNRFLQRRPTVILDRDGVLNKKMRRAEYVRSWADWEWCAGATTALRILKETGYRVLLATNQAGIAREVMTDFDLKSIHERLHREVAEAGGYIDGIYVCPHGWGGGCRCRKPNPGMLFQAQKDWELDLSLTPVIGDDERDAQAASAAGCPFLLVSENRSLLEIVQELIADRQKEATA